VSLSAISPRRILLVLAVLVAAVVANPTWAAAIGIDVWNLPALHQGIETGAEQRREFDHKGVDVLRRIDLKDRLVADLIAGRSTLAEVTGEFLDLNRDRPGYLTALQANFPGQTDEERTARNVLFYVSHHVGHLSPADRAEVKARLESELARLVATSTTTLH
jgi:hypothetical protein